MKTKTTTFFSMQQFEILIIPKNAIRNKIMTFVSKDCILSSHLASTFLNVDTTILRIGIQFDKFQVGLHYMATLVCLVIEVSAGEGNRKFVRGHD